MSMYVHATIKIKPGKMYEAYELLGKIVPEMEKGGWKLIGAYQGLIGQTSTIVDIWEVQDANAVPALMASLAANPTMAAVGPEAAGTDAGGRIPAVDGQGSLFAVRSH